MTLDLQAVGYNKGFFKRGMVFSGVFSTEQDLGENEAKRMMAILAEKHGGQRKMHEAPVFWGGVKYEPMDTMTNRDGQFQELRQMNREEIVMSQQVPLEAVGLGQRTFENVEHSRKIFWAETVKPIVQNMEDSVNRFLIPQMTRDPMVEFEIDMSGVEALREDRGQKMQDFERGFGVGAVTPNEIRTQVFNLDPSEDPVSNQFFISTRYLPLGSDVMAEGGGNSQTRGQIAPGAREIAQAIATHAYQRQIETSEGRAQIWRDKVARVDPIERRFLRAMRRFFRRQRQEVLDRLSDIELREGVGVDKQIIAFDIFDEDFWSQELQAVGDPIIISAVLEGATEIFADFNIDHPSVRAALANRQRDFAIRVNSRTNELIQAQLHEGLAANENIEQLAERLDREIFDFANRVRARRIARTETVGAVNFGTAEGIQQSPAFSRKVWITSRDERVRDTHVPMDGVTVGVDQPFQVEGEGEIPFPQAVNERCFIVGAR